VNEPRLTLYASDLCWKWGFGDGDCPDNLLDYWDEIGAEYPYWHDALCRLVRKYLVPAMEDAGHEVVVYDIETIHNPIRAAKIDGVDIDDYAVGPPMELRPEFVEVPYSAIAEVCGL
jgi:hypothetical protein